MRFIEGDVTKAPEEFIAHGCNAQGVMNSGVAKAIRQKWPSVYDAYKRWHQEVGNLSLGTIQWNETLDGKTVINCITQRYYGYDGTRYASPEAINSCLTKIAAEVESYEPPATRVAIPWIGCGLGGLQKQELLKIVGSVESKNPGVEFVLYELT